MARAAKVCAQPGCTEITTSSRCPAHQPKPWSTGNAGISRGGRPWRRQRQQTFERDNWTCVHCGHHDPTGDTLECDHDDNGNLRTLCIPCHKQRTREQSIRARWGRGTTP